MSVYEREDVVLELICFSGSTEEGGKEGVAKKHWWSKASGSDSNLECSPVQKVQNPCLKEQWKSFPSFSMKWHGLFTVSCLSALYDISHLSVKQTVGCNSIYI